MYRRKRWIAAGAEEQGDFSASNLIDGRLSHRNQLPEQQRRVDRLAEAIANAGWSEALGKQLRDDEAKLAQLRVELAQVVEVQTPTRTPSEAWLRKYFDNLIVLTEAAPTRGKQALQGWFGPVKVIPVGEGADEHFEAEAPYESAPPSLRMTGPFSKSLIAGALSVTS